MGYCQGWTSELAGTREMLSVQVYNGADQGIASQINCQCVYEACINSEVQESLQDTTQAIPVGQTNTITTNYYVHEEAITINLPTIGTHCINTHIQQF